MSSGLANSGDCHDLIVIGAGLAGLATAAAWVDQEAGSVLVLEAERFPGMHSSGRNAGMIRQVAEDPSITEMCLRGTELLEQRFGRDSCSFKRTGSLIFDAHGEISPDSWKQVLFENWSSAQVKACFPELQHLPLGPARFVPGDGVVEVPALIGDLIDTIVSKGGQIQFGTRVGKVSQSAFGELSLPEVWNGDQLHTDPDQYRARQIVIANGAWAQDFSRSSGVEIQMKPTNRSGLITSTFDIAEDPRPWIWAREPGWYLRPGAQEYLWSSCEEVGADPGSDLALEDPWERLLRVTESCWGDISHRVKPLSQWVGQRSFCPDRRFLLGPDPRMEGLHWAVGLGGHGVTCSLAVGEVVSSGLLGHSIDGHWLWAPERFVDQVQG
ncbi:MAG: FAD-dependent oxidoreductase [Planctomycetia bacterium]|nr:FAD-dependent oxidoreductase [Planctomycetia bacterium]